MEAYCMKCKAKREITDPVAAFNKLGAPVTRGTCPVCGTALYRTGRTVAHEGLSAPVTEKPEPKRSGKLVIVESPAKAKTVGRFLGKGYTVKASVGHVRDLLRSQLSVDVDNGFEPKYRVPNEKKPVVKELKQLAKSHSEVFLATPSMKSLRLPLRKPSAIPARLIWIWSMRSRPGVFWTAWWVIRSVPSCGKKCAAVYPLAGFNRWRCG